MSTAQKLRTVSHISGGGGGGGTPPSVRGTASGSFSGGSLASVTIAQTDFDHPPQSGDWIVAFLSQMENYTGQSLSSASNGATFDDPSPAGFTVQVVTQWHANNGYPDSISSGITVATRVATGSEGSYTFTVGGGTDTDFDGGVVHLVVVKDTSGIDAPDYSVDAGVAVYSGLSGGTPITGSTFATESLTTTHNGALLLACWGAYWSNAPADTSMGTSSWTAPVDMTKLLDTSVDAGTWDSDALVMATASKTITTAGSTGAQTGTVGNLNSANANLAITAAIALKP